jgi:hypothetical protein
MPPKATATQTSGRQCADAPHLPPVTFAPAPAARGGLAGGDVVDGLQLQVGQLLGPFGCRRRAAAQPPEQARVLRLARVQDLAVGGHDLEAGHVVAGQAELPGKPAHSPAEGQAAISSSS